MTLIIVNHLTRMEAPRICVAGMEQDSKRHIRPTTGRINPLTRALLEQEGGPFRLGAIVDLGKVKPAPNPPETEDHAFRPEAAVRITQLDGDKYLDALYERAYDNIEALFGNDLVRFEWNYAIDKGRGTISLGILSVKRRPDLEVDRYGKLKLRLNDSEKPAYLSVTDLRFVDPDHKTIRTEVVDDVKGRMRKGVAVLLMLGLARAFQRQGDDRHRHWLQVNGICMVDRPLSDAP